MWRVINEAPQKLFTSILTLLLNTLSSFNWFLGRPNTLPFPFPNPYFFFFLFAIGLFTPPLAFISIFFLDNVNLWKESQHIHVWLVWKNPKYGDQRVMSDHDKNTKRTTLKQVRSYEYLSYVLMAPW